MGKGRHVRSEEYGRKKERGREITDKIKKDDSRRGRGVCIGPAWGRWQRDRRGISVTGLWGKLA